MDAIEAAFDEKGMQEAVAAALDSWGNSDTMANIIRAAIAAYLAATGVERDAERYRWLADGRYCLSERKGVAYMHVSLVPDGEDKESLDAAIDSARGGEHG